MADPLSQLRQFHINGREIKEHNGYIIFGDHGWPKNVNTNYQIYSTSDDADKSKKEYYTLECLLYFLKNTDVGHTHYVRQAGRDNIPAVHRPDRKNLLSYLKGENQTSPGIDKNAPIPALRLPVSEIYKKDQHASGEHKQNTSSQSSTNQSGHNDSQHTDSPAAKKRPHDPEMEMKLREDFKARLYEPSNKKVATVIPTEVVEKSGESAGGSAAIERLGVEKLAAMKAKYQANKRTTIIDADTDIVKSGASATDPSRKEDQLYAMDSDKYQLIKSKEKIWRTRSSILQAQSKNFAKTVLPMVALLGGKADEHYKGKPPSQIPPIQGADMQMNSSNPASHHHQQQQQAVQRSYNRYDQERFVKLDIGVEIDTKKSFVSGVANGIPGYGQAPGQVPTPSRPVPPNPTTPMGAPNGAPTRGPSDHLDGRYHRQTSNVTPSRPSKRQSTVPIIIIPATTTSLINMYNAQAILQDLTYVEGKPGVKQRENELLIQRKKADGTHAAYKIMDNPLKLDTEDWNRVVAVFVQGPAWQFKGWPWGGSPVEIFSRIKGFHLKWDESKTDDNVAKWNVDILNLSRNKRHLDKANLLKFWSLLDNFMTRYKSFLKF